MPIATPQGTLDFKSVDKVTFVGASSNTVIDTTTGSLGVGVGVNGPTSNLHVVGNALITGNVSDLNIVSNVNMLHTANTASIKLNSNVVTEFPRSKKLIKYPRVAMTTSTISEHTASASTVDGTNYAWRVFDTVNPEGNVTSRWRSGNYVYTSNSAGSPVSGTAAQLSASSGTPTGEYILLTLPEKMCLKRYSWSGLTTQGPKEGEIWGSNDGSSWSHVHTFTNGNSGWVQAGSSTTDYGNYPDYRDVDEGNVAFYSRYAFIITKLAGADVAASVRELEYYGVPEYDPDAHGTDVVVKSIPNVPNTDWLEVYYDAKNYSGSGDVQDETGNNIDATIGAATTFDSVNKAWSFSGTSNRDGTEFVSGYLPSDFEGQQIHSVSMWLKFDYWHEGAFCIIGKETRTNSDDHKAIHFQFQGTNSGSPRILYDFWDNQKSFYLPDDVQPGKWLHMTATYSGDAANRKMFVNGQELTTFTTNSAYATELALDTTNDLVVRLGTRFPVSSSYIFHGDIANFRLFNRALSSDEVWQLYAYQKEYFGHGDLSMTLKAGRLGIGTSEPRAALDVKGDTFSRVYKGGRTTFLTWDYVGQKYVDIAAVASGTSYPNEAYILDYTFDIPSCYHSLGTANLKAFVQIDWRGEVQWPWNFGFRIELTYNGNQIAYSSESDHAASYRNKVCGVVSDSYHNDYYSTPDFASVTSQFTLNNCDVSPGSTLKVQLVGRHGDTAGNQRVWTGRTKGNVDHPGYELPINSFFVVLDVNDGY